MNGLCCCHPAQEYSADAILAVLRELTPANLRVMLASKRFKACPHDPCTIVIRAHTTLLATHFQGLLPVRTDSLLLAAGPRGAALGIIMVKF